MKSKQKLKQTFQEFFKTVSNKKPEIKQTFEIMVDVISEIEFSGCSIEITPSKTLKFILTKSQKMIMCKKPIVGTFTELSDKEVVVSFFENRCLLYSVVCDCESFSKISKNFLNNL